MVDLIIPLTPAKLAEIEACNEGTSGSDLVIILNTDTILIEEGYVLTASIVEITSTQVKVSYDESLLLDPNFPVDYCEHVLCYFCYQCLGRYVTYLVNQAVFDIAISEEDDNAIQLLEDGLYVDGANWKLAGNLDTTFGSDFLGTLDEEALDIRVNNISALRLYPSVTIGLAPSLVGGYFLNEASGIAGTITGGGNDDYPNRISNSLGTDFIGAGAGNRIELNLSSVIVGGFSNIISAAIEADLFRGYNFIGSGSDNTIMDSSYCAIATGLENRIELGTYNSIGGGNSNQIIGLFAESTLFAANSNVIGGGVNNFILASNDEVQYNTISGGDNNTITDNSGSVIGGGDRNTLEEGDNNLIAGGRRNTVKENSILCAILGGEGNEVAIESTATTILGGASLRLGSWSVGYQNPENLVEDEERYYPTQIDLSLFPSIGYFGDVDIWVANTNNVARKVKFFEPNIEKDFALTNYSSFEAQSQSADVNYILPAAAGTVGQVLKIASVVGTVVTLAWSADAT